MALELSGEIGNPNLIGVIREIYLAQASGVLEVTRKDRRRRFFFHEGELYLPGSHFLGKRLGELLTLEGELRAERGQLQRSSQGLRHNTHEGESQRSAQAREQLQELVVRIVDVLVEWQSGRYELVAGGIARDSSLVGPLPTAYLVMDGTVRDVDTEQEFKELGGADTMLLADTSSRLLQSPYGIDPGEMFLLSRAETPTTLGELMRQLPEGRDEVLRRIIRLHSVDLLRVVKSQGAAKKGSERQYTQSMVERFQLRFASMLPKDDVPLPEGEVDFVRSLVQRFAGLDHYELLGLQPDASTTEVHDAYQKLALRVHPGNARRLGLERGVAALGFLFERATTAYLTLSAPERRAQYNIDAGVEMTRGAAGSEGRTAEQRQVALANFRRASRMLDVGEYHFALELARQAVTADPQAEYIALLARIQRKNPNWVNQAAENYRQAVRLEPKNPTFRLELAQLMEETGFLERAQIHYQATLQLSPGEGKAMEGLARVKEHRSAQPDERSFMGRIKDIWGNDTEM